MSMVQIPVKNKLTVIYKIKINFVNKQLNDLNLRAIKFVPKKNDIIIKNMPPIYCLALVFNITFNYKINKNMLF